MIQKPGDLLFSLLEFFGILIPGAIFTFLHGDDILRAVGVPLKSLLTTDQWVPIFFISILAGNLLHGLSDWFDRVAVHFLSAKTRAYLDRACETLTLPVGIPEHPRNLFAPDVTKNLFYAAFSYIRVKHPVAVAELERHAGDFKLFRSLTLLFLLESALALFSLSPLRFEILVVMTIFAAFRYMQLFDWCYSLAFDLYLQVRENDQLKNLTHAR